MTAGVATGRLGAQMAIGTTPVSRAKGPGLRKQHRLVRQFLAECGLANRYVRHRLPLYIVAGPRGSGKTLLLKQVGCSAECTAKIGDAVWSVSRDALFVEIAPGLEPKGICNVWKLLTRIRPNAPLNGIILVISPVDLMPASEAQRTAEFVGNLIQHLGKSSASAIPAYLFITKLDLLPGARIFMDQHEARRDSDPLGFLVSRARVPATHTPGALRGRFDSGFHGFLSAVRERRFQWLSSEAEPRICAGINGFAAQLSALQINIQPVLDALFREESRTRSKILPRGVFFASARQESGFHDMLALAERFHLPPMSRSQDVETRPGAAFITGAFRKIVFHEAGLALEERRSERIGRWLALAAIPFLALAVALIVFQAFDREQHIASRLSEESRQMAPLPNPSELGNLPEVLARLARLQQLLNEFDSGPRQWSILPSGEPIYPPALKAAIHDLRRNVLLPHLTAMLETQLVNASASVAELREALAATETAKIPNAPALRKWLERAAVHSGTDTSLFLSQSRLTFEESGGMEIDAAYVEAARRILADKEAAQ